MKILIGKDEACKSFSKDVLDLVYSDKETYLKIELARWLGRFLTHNFLSIYSCDEVEDYLSGLILDCSDKYKVSELPGLEFAIVATALYKHGGHTRMIESTISAFENFDELILTQGFNSDRGVIEKIGLKVLLTSVEELTTSAEEKIFFIYNRLVKYKNVVLYTNPDDIECAIAIRIDKKLNGDARKYFFVNHSDHTFSFGKTISDMVMEVSNYGWTLNRRLDLSKRQSFLGIPITTSKTLVKEDFTKKKIVLSGGAAFKFRSVGRFSLYNHLTRLMEIDENLHIYLIGPSYITSPWLSRMKLKFPKRFYCINRVDHLSYMKLLGMASVYIDSYPITGGTAFTEALLSGLKVIGLSGCPSGYGYADQLRVGSVNNFTVTIQNLLNDKPEEIEKQAIVRYHARNYHGTEAFSNRLKRILRNSEIIDQETFSNNTELDYDFSDIFKIRNTVYCPDLNITTSNAFKNLLVLGLKNGLGIDFSLKLIIRWGLKKLGICVQYFKDALRFE